MTTAALAACLLFASTQRAGASDWPTYLGNYARDGFTADSLSVPLAQQWVHTSSAAPRNIWTDTGRRVIEGKQMQHRTKFDDAIHVAIAADRVYFGSSVDHVLHCVDVKSGEPLWGFFTDGPIRLAPTVWQDKVYFGSDDGYAYCLDAADGRLIWKLRAGPADEWFLARGEMSSRWPVRTGVLVDDGVAYFGAGTFPHENIYLVAVRADDGAMLWTRDNISQQDAGRDDLTPQGYMLAAGDLLVVPSGRSLPAVFDCKTGEFLHKRTHAWRSTAGGPIGGSRALLADGQIFCGGPDHLLAMEQRTGDAGYGWFAGRQMTVAGETAYTLTGQNVVRLDLRTYAEASRNRHELELNLDNLSRAVGKAGDKTDEMRKRIADLRKQLNEFSSVGIDWKVPCEADAALIVAGNLVVAGGKNQVTGFDIQTGKEAFRAEVEGEARGLAVAGGRLLVSTTTGSIYCFAGAGVETAPSAVAKTTAEPFAKDQLTAVYQAAAADILKHTGVTRGFCLVLDSNDGRLAYELAKQSELEVFGVEPDEKKVAASRLALSAAGYYGSRVTIHHGDPSALPHSNYFANLIVSDNLAAGGQLSAAPDKVARHLKPAGGVICLGRPANAPGDAPANEALTDWLKQTQLAESTIRSQGFWVLLQRGLLPGADNWSHQYGDPGNTASTEDTRVRGGLGVLWFGDPGPDRMVNRHEGAVGPLAVNGRLFVQGENSVMAYDAYNGLFLWEVQNPEALRTGVFQNYNPGNMVASADRLFVMIKDVCLELDAETGEVKASHRLPADLDDNTRQWGYVALRDGRLIGTATRREVLDSQLRRRGRQTEDATDAIFAIDLATGSHLWKYQGKSISHHTVALGPDRVFFIDSSITGEQREVLLRQDKEALKKLSPEEAKKEEQRLKNLDIRFAVALDGKTGTPLWSLPVDVTDCSEIGTGGGKLTLMYSRDTLVLGGANANGHYWKQFVAGEFSKRRLVALSAKDGSTLWARDANYRHRPIIIGDQVLAEPWSFNLYSGEQRMRANALTNEPEPWSIMRTGHHCGMLTGSPNMLLFRSGYTGFYDLTEDAGIRHFSGHRLGCWINAIPANGLVMIPEASAGCVCLFSIASTIVMEPRQPREPWSIYSSVGDRTPVKHMALNLGAPGDRKDARGTLWLTYPRPKPYQVTGLEMDLDLDAKLLEGGGYFSLNAQSTRVSGTPAPWLFTSAARGLTECSLELLGKDDEPALYTVKLYFAELEDLSPGTRRRFDVKLQGKTVLKNLDILAEARGQFRALVREIRDVEVTDKLAVELVPGSQTPSPAEMPILSAIEVVRTGSVEKTN